MQKLDAFGVPPKGRFDATGFFHLERTEDRWWLVDPAGNGFITVGLNHIEETNLKYPHNFDIWKERYGLRERWIREGVVPDLKKWGFNTIGWTQEWVTSDLRHTRGWSFSDFQIADMPYCVLICIAEIERWNWYPHFPDVFSVEFDAYCEYLARSICVDHAESQNLVGYFLVDIPAWSRHPRTGEFFKGVPDPNTPEGEERMNEVAQRYYQTICQYVRKYDPNHLILGDRYDGNAGIPEFVLEAMAPHVDILSIQYFDRYENMIDDLRRWQACTGKPVLLADIGNRSPSHFRADHTPGIETQRDRADDYVNTMSHLITEPWFIGWHWCAYVENKGRGYGVKDPWDEVYQDFLRPVAEFNRRVYEMI